MKKSLSTHEAKTHLSKLIEDVLSGAEVVVCRGKSPVVKIVRYQPGEKDTARPKVGVATSSPVKYSPDAFAPLSDDKDLADKDLVLWGMK